MNIIEQIKHAFFDHLKHNFSAPDEIFAAITFDLTVDAEKEQFGDITSNAALMLAKSVGQNPRDVALQITKTFNNELIEAISVAGPGFINMTLNINAIQTLAYQLLKEEDQFFKLEVDQPRAQYSVEFVSANPTGPLHLGHGRGGIIGDVLGNILRFVGHHVTKEYYINDAGAQIKKLGHSFKIRCQQLAGIDIQLPEEGYHGQYLVDLAQQIIAGHGKEVLQKPEEFFGEYAKNALLQRIRNTLDKYGIQFDVWFSEKSLYDNNAVQKSLQLLTDRGFTYEDDGALWFTSTKFGDDKDRVLKKSDGEYTYIASDVAYLLDKLSRGSERLIFILGQDHHSYVQRLKGIMQACGYKPADLDVILYQLVTVKESGEVVRLSKRAGRIVSLEDIIETVGKDVARFFYLHRKADAHLDFDLALALKRTEENPVYYVQYAYVRTGSILEKAQQHPELSNITNADIKGIGKEEKLLLKKIISLKTLLHNVCQNYQTHLLTYYVIELAHLFHRYYNDHRVIEINTPEKSRARLLLMSLLRMTFATCFSLLEINKPEKM